MNMAFSNSKAPKSSRSRKEKQLRKESALGFDLARRRVLEGYVEAVLDLVSLPTNRRREVALVLAFAQWDLARWFNFLDSDFPTPPHFGSAVEG